MLYPIPRGSGYEAERRYVRAETGDMAHGKHENNDSDDSSEMGGLEDDSSDEDASDASSSSGSSSSGSGSDGTSDDDMPSWAFPFAYDWYSLLSRQNPSAACLSSSRTRSTPYTVGVNTQVPLLVQVSLESL